MKTLGPAAELQATGGGNFGQKGAAGSLSLILFTHLEAITHSPSTRMPWTGIEGDTAEGRVCAHLGLGVDLRTLCIF